MTTLMYVVGSLLVIAGLFFLGAYGWDRWANRRRP
jgi:hypothetical protein